MKYLNKESINETEKTVQAYYHSLGYTSIKRGWPDFCFYRGPRGKREYIFVEVKRNIKPGTPFYKKNKKHNLITPAQRRIKNIFQDLGLDYRVCFGLLEDGTPNLRTDLAGINKRKTRVRNPRKSAGALNV